MWLDKKIVRTACIVVTALLMVPGGIRSALADEPAQDIRVVVDASVSIAGHDPYNVREMLVKSLGTLMLDDNDYFGVWTFGRYVDMPVKYGKLLHLDRQSILKPDYLRATATIRNVRDALERVAFINRAEPGLETHIVLIVDGPVATSSPIKDALLEDYIIKNIAPALRSKSIRVNILQFENEGELFYQKLARITGGQYLTLKDKRNKPFDALRFVSDMTGTAVELAANNHFAITIPNEQVGVIIPNTRPDGAKILHPDGWVLTPKDSPNTINWATMPGNAVVEITPDATAGEKEVSFWTIEGVGGFPPIVIGHPAAFIAGVEPNQKELIARRQENRPLKDVVKKTTRQAPPPGFNPFEDAMFGSDEFASANWYKGVIGLEGRYFFQEGYRQQDNANVSVRLQPEIDYLSESGNDLFELTLFGRWDQNDENRTHFDVRDLLWTHVGTGWETKLGVGRVFWGVTESQHLVDIVNQTDWVEHPDGEDKLGQPMFKLGLELGWGNLDLFALPYFRERTYPDVDGRFGPILPIDTDNAIYAHDDEEWHTDFAVRYFNYIGQFEFAFSYFSGTGREPELRFNGNLQNPQLIPVYHTIDQAGLEAQYVYESLLLKFEGITRSGSGDRYSALTTGFEYTQVGLFGSLTDLGWVVEYLFDDRGDRGPSIFENDWFVGWRWTMNDEASLEALIGGIWDPETNEVMYSIEASRRMGKRFKMTLEGSIFSGGHAVPDDLPGMLQSLAAPSPDYKLTPLRKDDYVQLELSYYF
ncbi:hypothetical protein OLMES_3091 [Oleiphilus messinensis]|uniref:VWFA domain-containing protein n=1 Tax=Oleiphilus messinensis TaxID=141451 RepID=A0A1Y0ICL6_9GAMM|nr:hypothetical protein OLMES_3091 [Oleiphilus messinensis]